MDELTSASQVRISDIERSVVATRLQRAHDVGHLDLYEFDERVRAVWAARTKGELDGLTRDLPATPLPAPLGDRRWFDDAAGGTAMRVVTLVWAAAAAINVVVWLVLMVTTTDLVYPWWLWVAEQPGVVLGVLYGAGIGRAGPRR